MTTLRFASLMRRGKMLALVLALLTAACYGQGSALQPWSAVLNSPELFVKTGSIEKGAPSSILLIGEIHNSIKAQKQLADLLQALYRTHQIDAILVEGSSGLIEAENLKNRLNSIKAGNMVEFWKGQLNLGHIAGYEYVVLTHPKVTAFGVEDMDAKDEYAIGADGREQARNLQTVAETHKRALALAKKANGDLGVDASRSDIDKELRIYEEKIEAFVAFTSTDGPRLVQAAETQARSEVLYGETVPAQILLSKTGRMTEADLKNALRKEGYGGNAERMVDNLKRQQEADKWLNDNKTEIEQLNASLETLSRELSDEFCLVANAIRSAAGGTPIPSLQTFFWDEYERERIQSEQNDPEVAYLADRNQHMLTNTMRYLKEHRGAKKVALIVGAFHVGDLTKLFNQENVNLLAGKLAASEAIEPWEEQAWEARNVPAERVLSSGSNKEKSRLQDPVFRQEMPTVVADVAAAGRQGIRFDNVRVFEVHTRAISTKSIVVTPDVSSLQASWGPYVVGSGKLPDKTGNYYQIFDRKQARKAASDATTNTVWFAPAYRSRTTEGTPSTNFDLPIGTLAISHFKAQVPSRDQKVPDRIVLASEGDAKPIHTALTGGSGPPSWTNTKTRFAEPPESRGPFLFFTKNISRARAHMDALEKEEPLKGDKIASFQIGIPGQQDSNLDELWFTPTRGDHSLALIIVGDNTEEFRNRLKKAAEAHLLENKQIALVTCFDPKETDSLREMLLSVGGVLTVWTPENRTSPDGGDKFQSYLERVITASAGNPLRNLDDYIDHALELWYREKPNDPDLTPLLNASRWTELRMSAPAMVGPSINHVLQLEVPQNGL